MNEISVVIIEDEIPAARLLQSTIKRLRKNWDVKTINGNIEDAVRWFNNNKHPDLIFLDIHLSDGNSFEFLSQAKPTSVVIFTTAYDEYAVRAFSVNSIDYILKPIEEKRLLEAIEKYENFVKPTSNDQYLNNILDSITVSNKKYRTRFLISTTSRYITVAVEDIAYFYSENKITYIVTKLNEERTIDISLDKLTDELDPDKFFRANRQTIVSIESIKKIEPYFNSKIIVTLSPPSKEKITISKEKASSFKVWLNY